MHYQTEKMTAGNRTPKMRRPEKADRTRSKDVKQRDSIRRRNRSHKMNGFN